MICTLNCCTKYDSETCPYAIAVKAKNNGPWEQLSICKATEKDTEINCTYRSVKSVNITSRKETR